MVETLLWSNEVVLFSTCTTFSSYEACYALNGSIACWSGAIEMHLNDSPLDTNEVGQHCAFNNSVAMILVVHVKMDLMELPV